MKTIKLFVSLSIIIALFLCSCTSVQKDIMISTDNDEDLSLAFDLESRIAELDAENLQKNNKEDFLKKSNSLISQINKKLSESKENKLLESKLNAFLGRLCEIQGNISKAKQYLDEATKKNKDEIQALILKRRLGIEKNIIKKIDEFESKGLIYLESAIEAFQNNDFDISSGEFDIAFLTLPGFYKEAYNSIRDKAWKLKDTYTDNIKLNTLLNYKNITVMQMIEITNFSSSVLEVYTGGKKLSGENLFNTLDSAGLFSSISNNNTDVKKISSKDIVTRKIASRYLWNIFCTGKKFSKTRYSEKYLMKNFSPVKDITVLDSDFDAVLGTIENEFLFLTDGLNFQPEKYITSEEFYTAIKKLK